MDSKAHPAHPLLELLDDVERRVNRTTECWVVAFPL
jgi:hypothetical protein